MCRFATLFALPLIGETEPAADTSDEETAAPAG
jgi:hypothetical protein